MATSGADDESLTWDDRCTELGRRTCALWPWFCESVQIVQGSLDHTPRSARLASGCFGTESLPANLAVIIGTTSESGANAQQPPPAQPTGQKIDVYLLDV